MLLIVNTSIKGPALLPGLFLPVSGFIMQENGLGYQYRLLKGRRESPPRTLTRLCSLLLPCQLNIFFLKLVKASNKGSSPESSS